jgi:formylglycine-generating enzyme required for sulfatase activity
MSRHGFVLFVTAALAIIATACAPKSTPPPSEPPAPVDAAADTAVPATAEVAAPASTAPPPRVIPAMEVGSTFRYFTGGLLIAVPGGPFTMGGSGQDNPTRTVTVDEFWIDQTEVTNRMYALCVEQELCTPPDPKDNPIFPDVREGNKPVVGVTWEQAEDYCSFVHGRLPTEAEWEKTARGPDGNTYPWGEDPPACDLLNFDGCVRRSAFVGQYPDGESYYKALDMSGNTFEWVADWYLDSYYGAAPTENPPGPEAGTRRSVRSTAFNSDGFLTEAARRFSEKPDVHRPDLGFRCVVEDPGYFAPFCTQLLAYGSNAPGGAGTGETLNEDCSLPTIEDLQIDCDTTHVWVDGNGGDISSTSGLEGCADGGMQMHNGILQHLYICNPGTPPVEACGTCEYPQPSGGASCPPGYTQDGLQCVVDQGAPGVCPPGSEYDSTLMCCSVTTGSGASYDLCAPGYSYVPGANPGDPGSCVDYVAGGIQCAADGVTFKQGCGDGNQPDCEDNPDDPACTCDPATNPNGCEPGGGDDRCPNGGTWTCVGPPTSQQCYCQ